jgi:hypothetical protein
MEFAAVREILKKIRGQYQGKSMGLEGIEADATPSRYDA